MELEEARGLCEEWRGANEEAQHNAGDPPLYNLYTLYIFFLPQHGNICDITRPSVQTTAISNISIYIPIPDKPHTHAEQSGAESRHTTLITPLYDPSQSISL